MIKLPDNYIEMEDFIPENIGMPIKTIGYQMVNEGTNALLFCMEVDEKTAMPFDAKGWVNKETLLELSIR